MVILVLGITVGCGDEGVEFPEPMPAPTPAPMPLPTPTPEPVVENPLCTETMGVDGGGGFLWKPEGENFPTLVVLLPGKFQSEFERVEATRKDGSVESLRFTGFSNFDPDGLRQTWRGDLRGGRYTGRVVAIGGNPMQECEWEVDRPAQRQD